MTLNPVALEIHHVKTYPAIAPQQSHSAKAKTVLIAGISSDNLGHAIAQSFAASGAAKIALMGDGEALMAKTVSQVNKSYPAVTIECFVTDMGVTESVGSNAHKIRASLGAWDVFVLLATRHPVATTLAGADTDEWWDCFEHNTRSAQHVAKHFMPKKRQHATYISVLSSLPRQPVASAPGTSAIGASHAALLRINEFVAAEHSDVSVFNVDIGADLAATDEMSELCGDFCVWLTSPEHTFLKGRFLSCSWDVTELVAIKPALIANPALLR